MTGPEHYREAERLLAEQHRCRVNEDGDPSCPFCVRIGTRAQVHATLALAAATAEACVPSMHFEPWKQVVR